MNAVFSLLPIRGLVRLRDETFRSKLLIEEQLRRREASRRKKIYPAINAFDGEVLEKSVLDKSAPWSKIDVTHIPIPGMISSNEHKYYTYISRFYKGEGEIVELGPWLGLSTAILISALLENPNFGTRKMFVFDDFTWRSSWMDKWINMEGDLRKPRNHDSFEYLFNQNLKKWSLHLEVRRRKISDYEGNEHLPKITWGNGPIEIMIIDCGRPIEVNNAWWEVFSPHFMKDKTLVIMQDWQNHKSVPEQHWENTKLFTDKRGGSLELIHEVYGGGIATFVYRG